VGLVGRLTGEVAGLPAAAVAAAGLAVGLLASGAVVDREAGLAGPAGWGLAGAARVAVASRLVHSISRVFMVHAPGQVQ
jgi:hypothetical protein